MKKIFYILTAAVVALGAMACENEGLENVAPEVNGNVESLSFTAAIDNSRVALDGLNNVWVKGDVVEIEGFEFVCQEDGVTFVGEGDGIRALIGKEVIAWYNETIDSSKGVAGASLKGTGVLKEDGSAKLTFELQSALLKYTTAETVTFAGTALSAEFTPSNNDGVQYIPVKAGEGSVSYSIGGVTCKSITTTFEAGQIYNLGTLKAAAKVWLLGDWDSWSAPLYMFEENNYYVAKNVAIGANEGFKFNDGSLYLGGASTTNTWNNFGGSDIKLGEGKYDIYVSKANGAWCAVTAGSSVPALSVKYVYLKPSSNWQEAGAKFYAWCWGGSSADAWISFEWLMYENSENYYYANVKDYKQCKFIRQDPNQDAGWNNWGATGDQTISNTLFTITGWASSVKWSSLIP